MAIVKALFVISGVAFFFALFLFLTGQQSRDDRSPSTFSTASHPPGRTDSFDLGLIAERINHQISPDSKNGVRLDRVFALNQTTLVYSYILDDRSFDNLDVAEFADEWERRLIFEACNLTELEPLRQQGITLVYRYHFSDGPMLRSVTVTPSMCRRSENRSLGGAASSNPRAAVIPYGPNHPSCEFKGVMTNEDYRVCGIRPPGSSD